MAPLLSRFPYMGRVQKPLVLGWDRQINSLSESDYLRFLLAGINLIIGASQ